MCRSQMELFQLTFVMLKIFMYYQGSHRLEKYLNLEGLLEKSLKIKSPLKSTGNHSKASKRP